MNTAWRIFYTKIIFSSPGVYLVTIKPTLSELAYYERCVHYTEVGQWLHTEEYVDMYTFGYLQI
jgi:hypothetical protein